MRRSTSTPTGHHYRAALIRPPKENCREKFVHFFWHSRNKTCMTRTPRNWLSILAYYSVFLLVVILIFYISMEVTFFTASLHGNRPQYVLDDSPIGGSPGVNYFPFADGKALIWLKENHTNEHYIKLIKKTLDDYKKNNPAFNEGDLGECATPPFGYSDRTPCIFFRLNRLFDWVPNPYINGNVLPDDMPKGVKTLIENEPIPKVWLFCEGSTAKDRDHITEEFFKVQGSKGFDTVAFPFTGQKKFNDPIVAVKLIDTQPKGVLYSFFCAAWSKQMDSKTSRVELAYYCE